MRQQSTRFKNLHEISFHQPDEIVYKVDAYQSQEAIAHTNDDAEPSINQTDHFQANVSNKFTVLVSRHNRNLNFHFCLTQKFTWYWDYFNIILFINGMSTINHYIAHVAFDLSYTKMWWTSMCWKIFFLLLYLCWLRQHHNDGCIESVAIDINKYTGVYCQRQREMQIRWERHANQILWHFIQL